MKTTLTTVRLNDDMLGRINRCLKAARDPSVGLQDLNRCEIIRHALDLGLSIVERRYQVDDHQ